MGTGFAALLSLFNNLTLFTALCDGFPLVEFDFVLFGLDIFFCRECVLVGRTHAVADIHRAGCENTVLIHEIVIDRVALDDFSQDVVQNRKIGIGFENNGLVSEVGTHVPVRRDVDNLRVFVRKLTVGNTRPKNRMGFGHIVAPQYHGVALLNIAVVVCRLINTEHLIETDDRARHTKTRFGSRLLERQPALTSLLAA